MFDAIDGFVLCTCAAPFKEGAEPVVHNKKSRRFRNQLAEDNPGKITWALYQYIGYSSGEYARMEGLMTMPSEQFSSAFTADFVQAQLNSKSCFDFEYTPGEGDYLVFDLPDRNGRVRTERVFMPFIFRNGLWAYNKYSLFSETIKEINCGKIRMIKRSNV